ncbi:MAG: hypothetical protein EZS28_034624, partial [Streblomastix strix]
PINDPSPTLTPSGTNTNKAPLEKPDYVTTMISVENEYVQLTEHVYTHLPVETCLLNSSDRITWILGCTNALDAKGSGAKQKAVEEFLDKNKEDLQEAVILVYGQLAAPERASVNTLIVFGGHARDIVEIIAREKLSSSNTLE